MVRQELHSMLRHKEISYLSDHWQPKERQFLRAHTRKLPNLGAFSNQRSESIHPVTTGDLHKGLTIEGACRRLAETIQLKNRQLALKEANSSSKLPRTLDLQAFSKLADSVTRYAIDQITTEWEITKHEHSEGTLQPTLDTPCESCELILRYGLPCKHFLILPHLRGEPIPRSLFHPRWWTNSLPIRITGWMPSFHTIEMPLSPTRPRPQLRPTSSGRNEITRLGQEALTLRDNLDSYSRYQFDEAIIQTQQDIVDFGRDL